MDEQLRAFLALDPGPRSDGAKDMVHRFEAWLRGEMRADPLTRGDWLLGTDLALNDTRAAFLNYVRYEAEGGDRRYASCPDRSLWTELIDRYARANPDYVPGSALSSGPATVLPARGATPVHPPGPRRRMQTCPSGHETDEPDRDPIGDAFLCPECGAEII